MTHAEELLRAILEEQRNIVSELRKLNAKPSSTKSSASTKASAAEVAPASDAELDGEHGNPVVKWDPKYGWDGPSYAGSRFSDCPADYLEVVAKAREASAAKK